MSNYYFSFGQSHKHPFTGIRLKDFWVRITSPDERTAREGMHKLFGRKWGTSYTEERFDKKYFPEGEYIHITYNPEDSK